MTLIYRERISPVLRPVNQGWQGKALCLFLGDIIQSAKISFNLLLSVLGILFIKVNKPYASAYGTSSTEPAISWSNGRGSASAGDRRQRPKTILNGS